jgi:serine/threonine protein kinase
VADREGSTVSDALSEADLHLGLLAIRNEYVNLSELKHCIDVRKKAIAKGQPAGDLGDVLVQQRYLTPQDLEYLHMIRAGDASTPGVDLGAIEAEFNQHVAELKPGAEFAAYHIDEEIGRGGMGIVFRATPTEGSTGESVALKILIGGKDATVRDIERFKKEATVMAPLIHPGIVKIMEVGRQKGLDFIAMEFVEGVSLKDLVGEKPLPDDLALLVIRSAAEAVSFMHSHGIIHRDIKPENIMVRPDGSAVLMDFGLAGWDKIEVLAGRGSIGTPMYQPPEQADVGGPFGKISEASDVYGLGATLYFLLTARHPFLGKSVQEVRQKIKQTPPDPLGQSNPKVHAAVEGLCLRCLKKRQNERFATPRELVENVNKVLRLVLEGEGVDKAEGRLTRRIAAASRKKSDVGAVAAPPKKPTTKKLDKGTSGKREALPPKPKSGVVARKKRQGATSDVGQAAGGVPPAMIVVGAVLAAVVLVVVGVFLFGGR